MTQTRATQIIQTISAWNASLPPEVRQQKYAKMAVSPFAFYRGTNHLYWQAFAGEARLARFGGVSTWLQGDLHAENFGAFTNDEGRVVYSVNDFDEAFFGDYQYDVWRMAISLGLGENVREKEQARVVATFAENYLETLGLWRAHEKLETEFSKKNTRGKLKKFLKEVEKENSRAKLLEKWTIPGGGRFDLTNDELDPVPDPRRDEILAALPGYLLTLSGAGNTFSVDHLHVKDLAVRLNAGTGSFGTPRYYLLVEGKSGLPQDDVILDVKRQTKPSAYAFLPAAERGLYDRLFVHDAHRAVIAYRAMTHNTDDYLGWMRLSDGSYLVRERTFVKEAFPLDALKDEEDFREMAGQWGGILASVHAQAARLPGARHEVAFAQRVVDTVGKNRKAFVRLVEELGGYAWQVRTDWAAFERFIR